MPAPKYYEGQEFVSDDPSKPTLVYRKGRFFPKEAAGSGGVDPQTFRRAQDSVGAIDDATRRSNWLRTGVVGGLTQMIPGTPAFNLDRDLDTLKARTAFNELAAMRAASPTGAALGAVSDTEMRLLQASEANLDVGQSEGQLDRNLGRMRSTIAGRVPGVDTSNPIPMTAENRTAMPEGAFFRAPDGRVYRQKKGAGPAGAGTGVRGLSNEELKRKLGL
jgi:hypothetical protein